MVLPLPFSTSCVTASLQVRLENSSKYVFTCLRVSARASSAGDEGVALGAAAAPSGAGVAVGVLCAGAAAASGAGVAGVRTAGGAAGTSGALCAEAESATRANRARTATPRHQIDGHPRPAPLRPCLM